MVDQPPSSDARDDDVGTPRWVYGFAIIAVVLILVFVIVHLAGGGLGRHTG